MKKLIFTTFFCAVMCALAIIEIIFGVCWWISVPSAVLAGFLAYILCPLRRRKLFGVPPMRVK